jgi:CheY-like chemotaxis protein
MQDWAALRDGVLGHLQALQHDLPRAVEAKDKDRVLAMARALEGSVMAIGLEEAASLAAQLPVLLAADAPRPNDLQALLARIRRAVAAADPPAHDLPTLATKVLVLEDDKVTRQVLRHMLENAGCEVVEAASCKEAYTRLAVDKPQAMLLDMHLPDGDGTLVCAAARREPRSRLLPVLVLTGDNDADALRVAYDAGADDFLVKPVRAGDLVMRLGMLMRMAGLRRNRPTFATA